MWSLGPGNDQGSVRIFDGQYRPMKLCTYFQEGRCTKGSTCTFAHCEEELHPTALSNSLEELAVDTGNACFGEEVIDNDTESLHEERVMDSLSIGPREFPENSIPKKLCVDWLYHSALCGLGDACPFAHGLMELGIEPYTAVQMQTANAKAQVDVRPLSSPPRMLSPSVPTTLFAGKGSATGKGFIAGKGAMAALPQSYGKAGFISSPNGCGPYGKGGAAQFGNAGNRFSNSQFRPSKLCQFWMKDPSLCTKGDACTFAHSTEELQPQAAAEQYAPVSVPTMSMSTPSRFGAGFSPTMLCKFWMQDPSLCQKGDACSFAHGEAELQSTPVFPQATPNSFGTVQAPSSRFRPGFAPVKLCQYWMNDPASCMKGNSCTFAHGEEELLLQAAALATTSRFGNTGFRPTKLCQFWSQDPALCTKGDACSFAHGEEELQILV